MRCKSARYVFSSILAIALFLGLSTPSFAQSKTQLQKQKAQLEAEIKKLDKELAKAKKNTKLTTSQLNALNKKIAERNKLIKNINSQVSILNNQIAQTQQDIALRHNQIDSMKLEYAKVIRMLYREHDNMDKLVLMVDAPSYNKAFLRTKYFNEYSRYRRQQAAAIRHEEEALQEVSDQLQHQKAEKSNLLAQEKRNKDQLTREQQQKQKSINTSKANEKNLSSQLSKKQQQKKELDRQIQRIINEEVAKAKANTGKTMTSSTKTTTTSSKTSTATTKPASTTSSSTSSTAETALSNDFAANKGKLSWPVYYKSVLREFGRYQHESGGENMSNGIELSTSPGAAVYCVFNGTVSRVFTCPNGTKGIIVRHGTYMTVYANLGSVSVKEGAKVTTKQTMGTVYTAQGAATGEVSFQIWNNTTPQNPRSWLR